MNNQYKITRPSLLLNYIEISFIIIFIVLGLVLSVLNPFSETKWIVLLWILLGILYLPNKLRMPHTVIINDSGKIIFKSLITEKEFVVKELISIKTGFINGAYLFFTFNKGKICIVNQIDQSHELIYTLKNINENIETRGC